MSTESLPEMKGFYSQDGSPHSNASSGSSSSADTSSVRPSSDPGGNSSPTKVSSHELNSRFLSVDNVSSNNFLTHKKTNLSPTSVSEITSHSAVSTLLMSQVLPVTTLQQTSFTELSELVHTKPLILQHPSESGEESTMSWLYDFYPSLLTSSKDKLDTFSEDQQEGSPTHEQLLTTTQSLITVPSSTSRLEVFDGLELKSKRNRSHQLDFSEDHSSQTIFQSQEKYLVTFDAPTSIAQRTGEDTLTYLNKGQFYTLYLKGNSNLQLPTRVKTVLALTFFEEADKRVEFSRWQYWYNMQPNPNQKAFDIDRKNCKNVELKTGNYHNAATFTWSPELGGKIVLRVNCLSTEFSSQKGVKGYTLHFVSDSYDDSDKNDTESVHRAFCKVKIFRDKGAERKNKDETKTVERRLQKLAKQVKQQDGAIQGSEIRLSLFHAPSRETVLTSTSTLGPKPFLFVPQQDSEAVVGLPRDGNAATDFLANIRDCETKRTFGNTLRETKEVFGALEVDDDDGAPPKKTPRIPSRKLLTLYVRKEEELIYNALLMDSLTVYDFKFQVAQKYDVPVEMIKDVFKKTKKGLIVRLDDSMIELFQNEDDFVIELVFDNHRGCFDLYLQY